MGQIQYRTDQGLPIRRVPALYTSLNWSSAQKPRELEGALRSSHSVITAWDEERLVGLGTAISHGHLVVYYPHLAVHPEYQCRGIGKEIVRRLCERYKGMHQQTVMADARTIALYEKCGFTRAGSCQALWIYEGHDHD